MTDTLTIRFQEYKRYDVLRDAQVVCFSCVTDIGTYHSEVAISGARKLRETREAFKQTVLGKIQLGQPAGEITIGPGL